MFTLCPPAIVHVPHAVFAMRPHPSSNDLHLTFLIITVRPENYQRVALKRIERIANAVSCRSLLKGHNLCRDDCSQSSEITSLLDFS